ncbi:KpsF/GutQ family sugar-phosphate isomerase [Thalassoglobus polymorphus]|uniref:KpsF/GutQ family sugar-phosphate isomerase n=1 Tax=Thalassoglobus polymorphus TaxID=2527994 RepID=UPI0011A3E606|nr:KpsF/GutQ family sugar-phosphate isomerase [Thalassoglobus polymorphus]
MRIVSSSAEHLIPYSQVEQLRSGREIVRQEAEALLNLARNMDASFLSAVNLVKECTGSVIVCGMGKAGLIGKKITATLSSTGTRAHFLHPAEAVHGDLGCLHEDDVLIVLSNSGETEEILNVIPTAKRFEIPVICITATHHNSLAFRSDIVLEIGRVREACRWGLAPSTSTTAMLALGDALALVVSEAKGFMPHHFAQFHPGGSLGQKLKPVTELMRPKDQLRIAADSETVRDVITQSAKPGRRTGAVLLVDEQGALSGLFTDSDLARLLETRQDSVLDEPVSKVMTKEPLTLNTDSIFSDVIEILSTRKISEIPVVSADRQPVGLIDITDVIGWLPTEGSTTDDLAETNS